MFHNPLLRCNCYCKLLYQQKAVVTPRHWWLSFHHLIISWLPVYQMTLTGRMDSWSNVGLRNSTPAFTACNLNLSPSVGSSPEVASEAPLSTLPDFQNQISENTTLFKAAMKALQAERRAVLYNSCQRSNSNFRDFSDKPHLSALYSDKYKVPRSDNTSQCCGRCRTFRKSVEFGNIFSINFSFSLHE